MKVVVPLDVKHPDSLPQEPLQGLQKIPMFDPVMIRVSHQEIKDISRENNRIVSVLRLLKHSKQGPIQGFLRTAEVEI
jgi:hypothetical protein